MKYFDWEKDKNALLVKKRGVSFEMVVTCIAEGRVLDRVRHPNKKKYPHQYLLIVEIDGYAYAVPYVEDDEKIFLKTIIPSRKLTHEYLPQE